MNRISLILTATLFALMTSAVAEDVTLTAYYPAPNGKYVNITSTNATFTNLSATNAALPTISGAITVNGLLTSSGNSSGISILRLGAQKASISSGGTIWAQSLTTVSAITGNSLIINDNTGVQTAAITPVGGISGTSLSAGNTGTVTGGSLRINDNDGTQVAGISAAGVVNGASIQVGSTERISSTGAITGTSLSAGSGTISTNGAITGGSISTSGGGITTIGTLAGGYLSVGSNGINSTGPLALWNSGTQVAGITTAGAITGTSLTVTGNISAATINGSSFMYTSSDARLKDNITPITGALDKVRRLTGVNYTFKKDPGIKHIGLIAQETEPVVPEVVRTGNDGMKGIEYAALTALLVEGIKEQQAQIEELKARIQQLEAVKK